MHPTSRPLPLPPLAAGLAALLSALACAPSPAADVGTVSIGFALGAADITRAEYEISAADISPSLTGSLTLNGDRAEGTVANVPAGANRTVTVRAYTGTAPNPVQRCSGSVTVTVTAGATVAASLLLTCTDELGDISVIATFDAARTPDSASATVSGAGIANAIVVPLSLGGGTLTGIVKNVPAGANRSVTVSTTKNGAVECTGMATVTVTAGATVSTGPLALTCGTPPPTTGSITINGQVNFTPRIHALTLSQPGVPLDGGTVTAQVVASDGDGDSLTYGWTLDGAASARFGSATAATSNFTATGLAAGSYTLTATATDGVTPPVSGSVQLVVGSNEPIGYCKLQWPPSGTISLGASLDVFGYVYIAGSGTTGTSAAGAAVGVIAQAGYGPASGDPSSTPGTFTWVPAAFNKQATTTNDENNDEHKAALSPPAVGTYRYAFRYSTNGGSTWMYCDLDGNTGSGFSAAQLGQLTVN